MSSSLRRGALAATALAISIASLSACAAGNNAQTLEVKPDNAETSVGDIKIQNAVVITQAEPKAEGPAVVSATLFNNSTEEQTLEALTLPGTTATVKLTSAKGSGPVTLPAGGSIVLGGEGNAAAVIENSAAKNGDVQTIAFRFSETGDVRIDAFVVPATSYYKEYGPTGAPQAPAESPAATPTGSPTGSPTAPPEGEHGGEATTTPPDSASASHDSGH
ncbi:DUF461 domain-containing protein [Streptomyces sp. NPDC054841]